MIPFLGMPRLHGNSDEVCEVQHDVEINSALGRNTEGQKAQDGVEG